MGWGFVTPSRGETMKGYDWTEEESEDEGGCLESPLMTVADAAKDLGVSRKTVYALLESGSLMGLKAKGSVKLVSKESLDRFRSRGELT
jgi:excisionase family DNA binding protein